MRIIIPRIIVMILVFWQATLSAADLAKPRLEVFKANRELQLFDGEKLVKSYRIALGFNPVPPKERQGDRATPESSYFICHKNPKSQYHHSLCISYPSPADAKRSLTAGLITKMENQAIPKADADKKTPPMNTNLGGDVFVHPNGSSPDWTWGCIAVEDSDIEELYQLVPSKTPITIHP